MVIAAFTAGKDEGKRFCGGGGASRQGGWSSRRRCRQAGEGGVATATVAGGAAGATSGREQLPMQPHWEEGTYPPLDPRARAAAAPDPCTLATITVEVERGSESERGRESERREWISWGDGATEGVDRVDWLGLVSSAHRCWFF